MFYSIIYYLFLENLCGNDWVPFGEEKCYRLVSEQIATWQKAKEICESLGDGDENGTLVMIKSKEEQDFIEDYLFNLRNVIENVWIGAKRSKADIGSEFRYEKKINFFICFKMCTR